MASDYSPQVGDSAILHICGSVYQHVVTKVISPTRIMVAQANSDGTPMELSEEVTFRKNIGRWITKGSNLRNGGHYSISRTWCKLTPNWD